jgi:hypothetical protein
MFTARITLLFEIEKGKLDFTDTHQPVGPINKALSTSNTFAVLSDTTRTEPLDEHDENDAFD